MIGTRAPTALDRVVSDVVVIERDRIRAGDLGAVGHLAQGRGLDGRWNFCGDGLDRRKNCDARHAETHLVMQVDGVLDDVALGVEIGKYIDGGVGDEQRAGIGRHVHDEDMADPAGGAKSGIARRHLLHQFVGVKAALHEQFSFTAADEFDGLFGRCVAVRRAFKPESRDVDTGGRSHGFQIWVNLPATDKMQRPRYQELAAANIPVGRSEDGLAEVRVIAGEALGVVAAIDTRIPIIFQDWTLQSGADVSVDIPLSEQAMVYVFGGALRIGDDDRVIIEGQLARLGTGERVRLRHTREIPTRALLLAGTPINEPVVRYGPFVMNNEAELRQAFADYQSGRMGEITREAAIG